MAALILASQSPRRQALLRAAGVDFRVVIPDIDEDAHQTAGHPAELAARTAAAKARAVLDRIAGQQGNGNIILAADTIVHLGDDIFNKPRDAAHARQMLRHLSGRTHTVHTGVALLRANASPTVASIGADVTFNPLSDELIDRYIASGEPMDKAGAYGIQGLGAELVARVDGDITGVIGLPMKALCAMFEKSAGKALTARPLPAIALDAFPDLARLPSACLAGLA